MLYFKVIVPGDSIDQASQPISPALNKATPTLQRPSCQSTGGGGEAQRTAHPPPARRSPPPGDRGRPLCQHAVAHGRPVCGLISKSIPPHRRRLLHFLRIFNFSLQ